MDVLVPGFFVLAYFVEELFELFGFLYREVIAFFHLVIGEVSVFVSGDDVLDVSLTSICNWFLEQDPWILLVLLQPLVRLTCPWKFPYLYQSLLYKFKSFSF